MEWADDIEGYISRWAERNNENTDVHRKQNQDKEKRK